MPSLLEASLKPDEKETRYRCDCLKCRARARSGFSSGEAIEIVG